MQAEVDGSVYSLNAIDAKRALFRHTRGDKMQSDFTHVLPAAFHHRFTCETGGVRKFWHKQSGKENPFVPSFRGMCRLSDPWITDLKDDAKPIGDFIYVLESNELHVCKIGRTCNWNARRATYSTEYPYPLKIIAVHHATRHAEAVMKNHARKGRIRGEWFKKKAAIAALAYAMQEGHLGSAVITGGFA